MFRALTCFAVVALVLSPAETSALLGDPNGDGQIDGNDLLSVQVHFGTVCDSGIDNSGFCYGDANGDRQVDGNDLLHVQASFGSVRGLPEPAAGALALLGAGALLRRRR